MKKTLFAGAVLLALVVCCFLLANCTKTNDNVTSPNKTGGDVVPIDTLATFNPNNQPTQSQADQAEAIADSAYQQLAKLFQSLDTAYTYDEVAQIAFSACQDRFMTALNLDAKNMKGNLGYAVSSIMSLNASSTAHKIVDSITVWDNGGPAPKSLGKLAKRLFTDGILFQQAAVQKPSFPRFLTMSFIQNAVASEVLPVLNNAVAALSRVEAIANATTTVTYEGENVKIDLGEVYVLDASVRFTRAAFAMMCMYNMNFETNSTDSSMSWVDSVKDNPKLRQRNYTLVRNDTVYYVSMDLIAAKIATEENTYYQSNYYCYGPYGYNCYYSYYPVTYTTYRYFTFDQAATAMRMLRHNLTRPDFMTLRGNGNSVAYADLLAIPAKLKAALSSIRNETGAQDNDVIKLADVINLDNGITDTKSQLSDYGISNTLADKFNTPESFLDFITALLSGPYNFNETIEGKNVVVKIDLGVLLRNPVTDLRALLPKYKWLDESLWKVYKINGPNITSVWDTMSVAMTYGFGIDTLIIDPARVDSIQENSTNRRYFLNSPVHYAAYVDSSVAIEPVNLIDDAGNVIQSNSTLPYFNDYTFGGLFPDLTTRQNWLDLIHLYDTKIN